jgi:ABC-type transporter Mla MlaB component
MLGEREADLVVCDVSELAGCDLATVNVLARLTLLARGLGSRVQVVHASRELRELLAFAGLADAVPCVGASGVEPRR